MFIYAVPWGRVSGRDHQPAADTGTTRSLDSPPAMRLHGLTSEASLRYHVLTLANAFGSGTCLTCVLLTEERGAWAGGVGSVAAGRFIKLYCKVVLSAQCCLLRV